MKNKKILKLLIVFLIILSLCTVLLRNTWVFAEDEEDVDENYVQEEPTNEESTSDEDENNAGGFDSLCHDDNVCGNCRYDRQY